MQKQKNRLLLMLGGAVILAVAGAFVYRQVQQARAVQMAQAAARLATERAEAARLEAARNAAEIAALEKLLSEANQNYSDLLKKYFAARTKAAAANKDALAKELQNAQRELADAIEKHPRILALKQELVQALAQASSASTNQGTIVKKMHVEQALQRDKHNTVVKDYWAQALEEQRKALGKKDLKDFDHLTPEEKAKLSEMQAQAIKKLHEMNVAEKEQRSQPSESEQKFVAEFKTLNDTITASNDHYAEVYSSLPMERALLTTSDPAIAALAQKVSAMAERVNAVVDGLPDLAAYQQQINDLAKQRSELAERLGALQRLSAGISNRSSHAVTGKNG